MKIITPRSAIAAGVGSLLFFYAGNRLASLYLMNAAIPHKNDPLFPLNETLSGIWAALAAQPLWLDQSKTCLMAGLIGVFIFLLGWLYMLVSSKHFRCGEEHGSARWGTKDDIKPMMDIKDPDNNIILSATERIKFDGKTPFKYDRNKNVLIIGGSGCGKTFGIIEPNLLQMHSSYIITDPKGTILPEMGHAFKGYEIRVLNTMDFKKSMHYNPLAYIHGQKDILKVVDVLMKNTKGDEQKSGGDPFWDKAEKLLYTALIAYLYYEAPAIDRNFAVLSDLIDACGASEENENYKSPVDYLFEGLEQRRGANHFAVKQYKKFKQAAGKTMKSILISCAARLAPFDIDEVRECMMDDELELDKIGDRKTALFIIIPDTDTTFSFIPAMLFYQTFNLLCEHADNDCGGKLKVPVRCMLDEFANIGRIPDFEHLISTIRSRRISATIILQSKTQITNVYKDDAETIVDCCDSYVFLGGKSTKTTEELAKMLGKETIDNRNFNETRGQQGSVSVQNQQLGRDLLDPAEIGKIDRTDCIVQITGLPPFRSPKYDLTKHPRFKDTGIANPQNMYDIAEEIRKFRKVDISPASATTTIDVSELNALQRAV